MQYLSLQPFIPSGPDFDASKRLFEDLGFTLKWSQHGYAGFERDSCSFILQQYDNAEFAANLMLTVRVSSIKEFQAYVLERRLTETYSISVGPVTQQPYGTEINIIDLAGVCWHFVE